MNAPPHATKFQDLQSQTAMPEPPLHGEEVWGEGKTMQNMYCSYPRQVDLQALPGGARRIKVKMGVEHQVSLTRCFGGFHPCSVHLDFRHVLVDFTYVDPIPIEMSLQTFFEYKVVS